MLHYVWSNKIITPEKCCLYFKQFCQYSSIEIFSQIFNKKSFITCVWAQFAITFYFQRFHLFPQKGKNSKMFINPALKICFFKIFQIWYLMIDISWWLLNYILNSKWKYILLKLYVQCQGINGENWLFPFFYSTRIKKTW